MAAGAFASDYALDGARPTDRTHRKLELQSPADLSYLVAKVSRTAREKIDKHLPPDSAVAGEDRMRSRVEMLVDDYIRNTFNLVKPNLSINGMDLKEMEAEMAEAQEGEEFEAFDVKLAQQIQDLSAQIEANTLELADLRRSAPSQMAARFSSAFKQQDAEMDARIVLDGEAKIAQAAETSLDLPKIERIDGIQQSWRSNYDELRSLGPKLDAVADKMEQAQKAVEHIAKT